MQKATISSGVAKYSGSFGQKETKHLLNRALFGPLKSGRMPRGQYYVKLVSPIHQQNSPLRVH